MSKDAEAADALGLKLSTFVMWRRSQALAAKRKRGESDENKLARPVDAAKRMDAYHNTNSDRQAAGLLGIPTGRFRKWRQHHGHAEKWG